MPSNSYSYQSFSSTSYSSSSTTDPQGTTKSYSETVSSNDRDGTTYQRTASETGKPTYIETTQIPAGGRQVQGQTSQQGRIEDVSDDSADQQYLERMEDEYAKREGGA